MTQFDIYLITILDNIKHFCNGTIAFTIICLVISFIIWGAATLVDNISCVARYKFFPIVCTVLLIFTTVLNTVTPTSKQMAIIYIVPKVVNSETIQQLPGNLMKLLDKYVEDLLKDDNKEEVNTDGK